MQRRVLKNAGPVLVAATLGGIIWVSAGDLNPPPGPVTPTMKTLVEIEPRIAINATNTRGDGTSMFRITKPGSYYLTGNVNAEGNANGLAIDAADVTVDLSGYVLIGGVGSTAGSGIVLGNVSNVEIRNGTVRDFAVFGVSESFSTGKAHRIINVRAVSNRRGGIHFLGEGHLIQGCTVEGNAESGITTGVAGTVTRNTVSNNGGVAILAGDDCALTDNAVRNNGSVGISAGEGSTVTGNRSIKNVGDGISVVSDCRVEHNFCKDNGRETGDGAGIHAIGSNNRIVGNHLTGADRGLDIDGSGNYVADNTVKGNTDNYDIDFTPPLLQINQLNILLSEIPESIDWPATVTLAGSLRGTSTSPGLTITAADVTIDLAGHGLIGSGSGLSSSGIVISGQRNVEIRNGTVRNFGQWGIVDGTTSARDYRVIDVRVVGNKRSGISLGGEGHLIQGCTATANGAQGILVDGGCTVIGNTASGNWLEGFVLSSNSLVDQNIAIQNDQLGSGHPNMSPCPTCTFGLNHAP